MKKFTLLKMIPFLFSTSLAGVSFATEMQAATGSAEITGNIKVNAVCTLAPVTVDFGDLVNISSSNSTFFKAQSIDFECKNIPANHEVRLKDLMPGSNINSDGYHYGVTTFSIAGQSFTGTMGIKNRDGQSAPDASLIYADSSRAARASQAYSYNAEFFIYLLEAERMKSVMTQEGVTNHSFNISIPLEVSLLKV